MCIQISSRYRPGDLGYLGLGGFAIPYSYYVQMVAILMLMVVVKKSQLRRYVCLKFAKVVNVFVIRVSKYGNVANVRKILRVEFSFSSSSKCTHFFIVCRYCRVL